MTGNSCILKAESLQVPSGRHLQTFLMFLIVAYAALPICFKKATWEATAYRTRGYSM
jgi:hypothetical protein